MIPFYGGLNGQSFKIKQVYNNRQELVTDLNSAWASAIGVGEYVAINYGKPGTDGYNNNRSIDSNVNFNSTVWQKVYDEELDTSDGSLTNQNGLGYKLLFWTTGNVPDIVLDTIAAQDVYDATTGEYNEPKIEEVTTASESPDVQHFEFAGVISQRMQFEDVVVEDADYQPTLDEGYTDTTRNVVTVTLHLPQGQVFNTQVVVHKSIAGGSATAEIDESNINVPQLNLTLPANQSFEPEQISTTVIAAAETPSVQQSYGVEDTYHENPLLNFSLPQAQIMREGEVDLTELRPSQIPTAAVEYTDATTKNEPYLALGLPRSVKFYKGSDLLSTFDQTYNSATDFTDVTLPGVKIEDCVLNTTLGFLYEVVENAQDDTKIDLRYVSTLYAPLPTVSRSLINTFDGDGEINQPSVNRTVSPTGDSWNVEALMPRVPTLNLTYDYLGAGETGSASLTPLANGSSVTLDLQIPQGSKWFAGTEVDDNTTSTVVSGAEIGDFYLNNSANTTSAGHVYRWNGSAWVLQTGYGLQGPTGPALNVIASLTVTPTEVADDTLAGVGAYLTSQGYNPAPEEIISVIYQDSDAIGYWYYKPGARGDNTRTWARVKLTGSLSAFTVDTYSVDVDKVYNTGYVNSLLKATFGVGDNKDRQTYNATAVDAFIATLTQRIADLEDALAQDKIEQQSWGAISDLIEG